jgi:transcriptional regulator GlxA family with amidase domain
MLARARILALRLKCPAAMKGAPDPRITWAVQHMQGRLDEPIAIAALAARVNLSPSRFRQLFTVQTGIGPGRYLQRLRLRRARLLIEGTFLSVKEVMGLAGYSDPSHFSRDFRRVHGVSPTALRRRGVVARLPRGLDSSANPPTHRRIGQQRNDPLVARSP